MEGLTGCYSVAIRMGKLCLDLSATTLLVLLFLRRTDIGKAGFNLNFIHVLTNQASSVEQRWRQF